MCLSFSDSIADDNPFLNNATKQLVTEVCRGQQGYRGVQGPASRLLMVLCFGAAAMAAHGPTPAVSCHPHPCFVAIAVAALQYCILLILLSPPPGLGLLSPLPDELLLELLFGLPAADLARLGLASKALYCFAHTSELWKALVIQVGALLCCTHSLLSQQA
jgi:hypothetical protein